MTYAMTNMLGKSDTAPPLLRHKFAAGIAKFSPEFYAAQVRTNFYFQKSLL